MGENNDITVVDTDSGRLRQLQDKFDLRVVQGHGSHPRVLREAGAEDADMLVAVTNSDETNMIACQIAYSLFNTPNRIARIRAPEYIRESEKLFLPEAVPIDHLISPEQLVIDYIYKLIEYPGALQVVNFAEGKVSIAAVKAYYGGPLVGNALSSMREHMPHIDTRVAAIFRRDRPIRPQGSTIIEAGDEVFFVAASQHIRAVMSELQRLEKPYKRIMIVGGGNVGAGPPPSWKKTTTSNLSSETSNAPPNWPSSCTIPSCSTAMPPTRAAGRRARRASGCLHRYHQRR